MVMVTEQESNAIKALLNNYEIIFGPPGTGKTRTLTEIIANLVAENGADSVMVTSFTRAAAAELVSRAPGVPGSNVRTLHSFGYAAQGGNKKVAEQNVGSWNKYVRDNGLKAAWALTEIGAPKTGADEPETEDDLSVGRGGKNERAGGDARLAQVNLMRNRMIPPSLWMKEEREFYVHWQAWKRANDLIDFTDMIEVTLQQQLPCPTRAKFFIVDEAQDCTPLQIALVKHWGTQMERVIISLDDDQAIYYFSGGDAQAVLELPVPEENQRVLELSHRVPRAVHKHAQRFIEQIPPTRRRIKNYHPRDVEGEVRVWESAKNPTSGTYQSPEALVEDCMGYVLQGKSIMFLATCAYMLDPLKKILREQGIPFHNPYRAKRNDWNPLTPKTGVASSQRLLAFLRPQPDIYGEHFRMWNIKEFLDWSDALNIKGVFKDGSAARKRAEEYYASLNGEPDLIKQPLEVGDERGQLGDWLTEEALGHAMDGDIAWYQEHLSASKRDGMAFPLSIIHKHGAHALMEDPKVTIGTIHSVKGAQADVVYLFPDISVAAMRGDAMSANFMDRLSLEQRLQLARVRERFGRQQQQDTIIRTFYVGMTRAKEVLVLCPHKPVRSADSEMNPYQELVHF